MSWHGRTAVTILVLAGACAGTRALDLRGDGAIHAFTGAAGRGTLNAAWSEDGQFMVSRIAVAAHGSSHQDIWIFDLADPEVPVNVTATADLGESGPTWAPDDAALAMRVDARRGRDAGIYVLDLGSRVAQRILADAGGAGSPAWRHNP